LLTASGWKQQWKRPGSCGDGCTYVHLVCVGYVSPAEKACAVDECWCVCDWVTGLLPRRISIRMRDWFLSTFAACTPLPVHQGSSHKSGQLQ
jgi:hypothetical protein